MKKFWKYAIGVIAVAGLVPYSHKKDKETGASVTQALLWSCSKKPDGDKMNTEVIIGLHLNKMPLPKAENDNEIVEEIVEEIDDVVETAEEVVEDGTEEIRDTIAEIVEATEAQ